VVTAAEVRGCHGDEQRGQVTSSMTCDLQLGADRRNDGSNLSQLTEASSHR